MEKLKVRKCQTFGNIFHMKKRVLSQLEGVQWSLASTCLTSLLKLEQRLKCELEVILFQEELLWKQKYRVEWIKEGTEIQSSSTCLLLFADGAIKLNA